MVDLISRETFLEYLLNRQQDGVYANGVPKQIRSDNAPELMQGIVRQLCAYLDISQVVTGGHNPRGNSIGECFNQTLGAMIRKLSDLEYKDLRLHLPAFEFVTNATLNSFGYQANSFRDSARVASSHHSASSNRSSPWRPRRYGPGYARRCVPDI